MFRERFFIRAGQLKMPVNQEKLQKLQSARIGGKGTSRRKKKIVHKTATDDKKVQVESSYSSLLL